MGTIQQNIAEVEKRVADAAPVQAENGKMSCCWLSARQNLWNL